MQEAIGDKYMYWTFEVNLVGIKTSEWLHESTACFKLSFKPLKRVRLSQGICAVEGKHDFRWNIFSLHQKLVLSEACNSTHALHTSNHSCSRQTRCAVASRHFHLSRHVETSRDTNVIIIPFLRVVSRKGTRGLHLVEWCATDDSLFFLLLHAQEIILLQLLPARCELLPSNYRFVFNFGPITWHGLQFGLTTKVYSKSNHHGRYLKPQSNHPSRQKGSNPSSSNRASKTYLRKQESITLLLALRRE
jgi:hypothetical protein